MSWDQGYKSPDEIEAQQRAAQLAQQQAAMTPFEKQLIDILGRIAENTAPVYVLNVATGARQRFAVGMCTAAGDGGGDSAGPVTPPPGPARPDTVIDEVTYADLLDASAAITDWINGAPCPEPARFRAIANRLCDASDH